MKKLLLILLCPILLLTSCSKSGVTPQSLESVIVGIEWCLSNENEDGFLLGEDGKLYITQKCQSNYSIGDWIIEGDLIKYRYTEGTQEITILWAEVTEYSDTLVKLIENKNSTSIVVSIYTLDTNDIYGCMTATAGNFNPLADCDDGSCMPIIYGCTDTLAVNYNPQANSDDGSCIVLEIGDFYEGGIIFWLDDSNKHGLICNVTDIGAGVAGAGWDCAGFSGGDLIVYELFYNINYDITSIGTGEHNTNVIVSQLYSSPCNSTPQNGAANLCYNMGWFLPSKDELKEMYINRDLINSTALSNGGMAFGSTWYWSSTESGFASALAIDFTQGNYVSHLKYSARYVRPIKNF
jgi:hypothetical protein